MIHVYYNRSTGEAFATDDSAALEQMLFKNGKRKRSDFEVCTTLGIVQILTKDTPGGKHLLSITTLESDHHW